MKMHTLVAALALVAGTAFAQAPASTAPVGGVMASTTATTMVTNGTHRKAARKHQAARKKTGTASMGAGAAPLQTDLQAAGRQARIDQAYAHWRSSRR